jgi:hypothetical protein
MSSCNIGQASYYMDTLYAKICMRFFILCAYGYVQICMCPAIIWVCCMRLFVCASCMCPGMCCTVFVCVSEKVGCFTTIK